MLKIQLGVLRFPSFADLKQTENVAMWGTFSLKCKFKYGHTVKKAKEFADLIRSWQQE